jgi:hypothetical protein
MVWDPDRYTYNPNLQLKAEDRQKQIDLAYEALTQFFKERRSQRQGKEGTMRAIKEDFGEVVGIWFRGEFLCLECTVRDENIILSDLGQESFVFSGIEGEDERCDRCKKMLNRQNAKIFFKDLEELLERRPSQLVVSRWENATAQ